MKNKIENQDAICLTTKQAYGDCNELEGRCLDYRDTRWQTLDALIHTLREAIPDGYNEFKATKLELLNQAFGAETLYQAAREGSVCIYVKPGEGSNIWIDRLASVCKRLKVDECTLQNDEIRLWWD